MNSIEIVAAILVTLNVVLGGGLIAAILKYRVQSRGEDRSDFSEIIEAMREQRREEREEKKEQDEKINQLEAEVNGLRIARDLDPFPNWLVDLTGSYLYVNREFEAVFLEPANRTYRDIIGQHHAQVWPEPFVRTLGSLDEAARRRPDGTARANTTLDIPKLGPSIVTVHKFPVRFKGIVIAYAGYITAIEPESERIS